MGYYNNLDKWEKEKINKKVKEHREKLIERAIIGKKEKRKKRKIMLSILAYLIPFFILIGLMFFVFQSFFLDNNLVYEVNVGEKGDTNSQKVMYLNKETASKVLSPEVRYGTETYREIINKNPFYVVFKPIVVLEDNTEAILKLEFIGIDNDIYINNELVFPGLANYTLLKSFDNEDLYIRSDFIQNVLYESDSHNVNAKVLLLDKFKGSSVYSQIPIELESPYLWKYFQINTFFPNTFRDNLRLAIYGDDISIQFVKQDLNWYNGADEYYVTITDLNGMVLFNQTYKDDGNIFNNSFLGQKQEYEIELENERGIYFVEFVKDNNNRAPDTTLKEIRINSNKVLIVGDFLPWDPIELYTNQSHPRKLGFYYWWGSKKQNIGIEGDVNDVIILDESYKEVNYPYVLRNGTNKIISPLGYLWIRNDIAFSQNEGGWFEMPLIVQNKINEPEFIILDKEKVNIIKKSNKDYLTIKEKVYLNNKEMVFELKSSPYTKLVNVKLEIE